MENILMVELRKMKGYSPARIASALHISLKEYSDIEHGRRMISFELSDALGKLYGIKGDFFYAAALQLDLLMTRKEVIDGLREEKENLEKFCRERNLAAQSA